MLNLVNNKTFSSEYTGFYQGYLLGDEPFYPLIHREGNIEIIDVELNIKQSISVAKQKKQHLLWYFSCRDLRQLDAKISNTMPSILPFQSMSFGFVFDLPLSPFTGKELFDHREQQLHFFRALAADLPENSLLFLKLDLTFIQDLQELFLFLRRDAFFPFQLICNHPELHLYPYASDYIGWHFPSCMGTMDCLKKSKPQSLTSGFLLPEELKGKKMPFELIKSKKMRIIPSSQLTELWEGMDDLYLFPDCLTQVSSRKVAGFQAAGGNVHYL